MALVAAKCTQCGAAIEVDATKEAGVCPNCGTAFITEKVVQNYNQNITFSTTQVVNKTIVGREKNEADDYILQAEGYMRLGKLPEAREKYLLATSCDPAGYKGWLGVFMCDTNRLEDVVTDEEDHLGSAVNCVSEADRESFALILKPYFERVKKEFFEYLGFYDKENFLDYHPEIAERVAALRSEASEITHRNEEINRENVRLNAEIKKLGLFAGKKKKPLKIERKQNLAAMEDNRRKIAEIESRIKKTIGIEYTVEDAKAQMERAGADYRQAEARASDLSDRIDKLVEDYNNSSSNSTAEAIMKRANAEMKLSSLKSQLKTAMELMNRYEEEYNRLGGSFDETWWASVKSQYEALKVFYPDQEDKTAAAEAAATV